MGRLGSIQAHWANFEEVVDIMSKLEKDLSKKYGMLDKVESSSTQQRLLNELEESVL